MWRSTRYRIIYQRSQRQRSYDLTSEHPIKKNMAEDANAKPPQALENPAAPTPALTQPLSNSFIPAPWAKDSWYIGGWEQKDLNFQPSNSYHVTDSPRRLISHVTTTPAPTICSISRRWDCSALAKRGESSRKQALRKSNEPTFRIRDPLFAVCVSVSCSCSLPVMLNVSIRFT